MLLVAAAVVVCRRSCHDLEMDAIKRTSKKDKKKRRTRGPGQNITEKKKL